MTIGSEGRQENAFTKNEAFPLVTKETFEKIELANEIELQDFGGYPTVETRKRMKSKENKRNARTTKVRWILR